MLKKIQQKDRRLAHDQWHVDEILLGVRNDQVLDLFCCHRLVRFIRFDALTTMEDKIMG